VGRLLVVALALSSLAVGAAPELVAASRRCGRSDVPTYTVAEGDSWFDIATTVGVGMSRLIEVNAASERSTIFPGDVLCLPPGADTSGITPRPAQGCGTPYTVAGGDSWFGIATSAGVSLQQLLQANGATADRLLHPGNSLCLPAGAKPPTRRGGAAVLEAFPLQGPCWFGDTWNAARGNGRRHQGVDLIAEEGKYVYAVVDGTLTNRAWDQPGLRAGNAWWLTAADGSGTYYFYAHLYAFAPGLKVGSRVEAGEIIGFVGNTGNSATAHLHFEIHPGGGGAVNPYSTIKAMDGCTSGLIYAQPSGWVPED